MNELLAMFNGFAELWWTALVRASLSRNCRMALRTFVISRAMPVNIRRSPRRNSLTARCIGNVVPSFRCPTTSRPMPMIFLIPVVR